MIETMERFTGITYVIPCGGAKLDRPAPARELYTGSMFRHTLTCVLAAAEKDETAGFGRSRVLILSALHGLVQLDQVLEPYDLRMGAPGSVTADRVREQATALGMVWGDGEDDRPGEVSALLPHKYFRVLDDALRDLYVYPSDVYEGCRGIGEQRRVNVHVAEVGTGTLVPAGQPAGDGPRLWVGGDVQALRHGDPVLVSYGRLMRAKTLPVASGPWVCDSRGFTEIMQHGGWTIPVGKYAADLNRYAAEIGHLEWAAPQDWPAAAAALARTGLTEYDHQVRTIDGYEQLVPLTTVPIIRVLTGTTVAGYLRHLAMWQARGHDLTDGSTVVGVGALVKRAPAEAADIIRTLHAAGVRRMHGFGLKGPVLALIGPLLESFDSAGWSDEARRAAEEAGDPGLCRHGNGVKYERNCHVYAMQWAGRQQQRAAHAHVQEMLPMG